MSELISKRSKCTTGEVLQRGMLKRMLNLVSLFLLLLVVVAFSSLERIWGECSTVHFPPALFFFFFFNVEINLRTLIPILRPESVHSGSASGVDCGRMFPDELRVSSFP